MPSPLDKLERALGRFAIPNLTLYLIVGQVFVVLSTMAGLLNPANLLLLPRLALAGEWWRVLTFLLVPISAGQGLLGIVSLVFGWWIFYFMGNSLESYWGPFRYNLFLLSGYVLTVGLSFLFPDWPVTYFYLGGSVFLVFAYLNPEFELLIFFIIPVKLKWLGLLTWLFYLYRFVTGDWLTRVLVGAAIANIVLFVGRGVWRTAGRRTRRIMTDSAAPARRAAAEPRHRCRICGKTDLSNPELDFRYCSKCAGDACYCPEHIFNHEHVRSADGARRQPERDLFAGAPGPGATLGEWLRFAVSLYPRARLALGQVSATAHDEALYLLLHALGLPLESPPSALRRVLDGAEREAVRSILERRVAGRVPATPEAWLGGRRFYVDERVIIPRSYFVELIPQMRPGALAIADVCTGSGCLAILLARHFPRAKVDAIDLSAAALEVAAINVRAHRLGRRVKLHHSDLFAAVPARRYDLIVSNPPYEPTARCDALPEEFLREPRAALDGGPDGLDIIRRLVAEAPARLAPRGRLLIEVGGLRRAIDREFAALAPRWLATEDGADCVCVIEAARLARLSG